MSVVTVPTEGISTGTPRCATKAGTLRKVIDVALPSLTVAVMSISPAGASSVNRVIGSVASTMLVSMSTVATQMVLLPDIAGYSTCSMIT